MRHIPRVSIFFVTLFLLFSSFYSDAYAFGSDWNFYSGSYDDAVAGKPYVACDSDDGTNCECKISSNTTVDLQACNDNIGSPETTCCTSGSCANTSCGTIGQWDWCHAAGCTAIPAPGDTCDWNFQYDYTSCGATDTCDSVSGPNDGFLYPGLCNVNGCATSSGKYKVCCTSDGNVAPFCTGSQYTGTCEGYIEKFCGFGSNPPCDANACAVEATTVPTATDVPEPTTTSVPEATATPVPCTVTTSPFSHNLTIGGTGVITASVTSGLGTATINQMRFGSYNTSIATVNPTSDSSSTYSTTATGVSGGLTAVWATADLSDGRTCQSSGGTDTDVNVAGPTAIPTATPACIAWDSTNCKKPGDLNPCDDWGTTGYCGWNSCLWDVCNFQCTGNTMNLCPISPTPTRVCEPGARRNVVCTTNACTL